jgi:hypothetical protein
MQTCSKLFLEGLEVESANVLETKLLEGLGVESENVPETKLLEEC